MRSLVEVRQKGYVINLLLTGQSLLMTGLALWLAAEGWGITGQSVALVAGTWAFGLAVSAAVLREQPGLLRAAMTVRPDDETRRELRSLSVPTLLLNLSGRVSNLTDNLVVGAILDTTRVNSLFNTQRLAALGQSVLTGVGSASWAGLAELHARGERETFNRRLVELSRLVAVLAVVGLGPVVAYNRAFIHLWLGLDGPDFTYGGDLVIVVAAVNVFLFSLQSLWAWCFTATGNVRYIVPQTAVVAVVNLSASVALTHKVGLVGPLLGTTIAMSTMGLTVLPALLRRVFGTPLGALAGAVGGPFLWGVVSTSGLYWLTRHHEPSGWFALGAEMSVAALASLAFSVAVLLTPEDRDLWRRRLQGLRSKPAPVENAAGAGR
jgi:O-antigen/teichoic acid export membrane protein